MAYQKSEKHSRMITIVTLSSRNVSEGKEHLLNCSKGREGKHLKTRCSRLEENQAFHCGRGERRSLEVKVGGPGRMGEKLHSYWVGQKGELNGRYSVSFMKHLPKLHFRTAAALA